MLPRTYIIFASDNGGCYLGGGKNAPLRGTKATILEGLTRWQLHVYVPSPQHTFPITHLLSHIPNNTSFRTSSPHTF